MRSTKIIKTAKLGYMLLSTAICALGILMISQPGYSADLIARSVGATLIVFGVVRIIGYCSKDLYRLAFQHDLALGMLNVALGLLIIFKPGLALKVMCLALGIEIVTDGLFKVQTALDARRFGLESWWLILALAVVALGVGVWLVASPADGGRALVRLLGASLTAEGILNLCVAVCAVKIIAHQQPDRIDERIFQ